MNQQELIQKISEEMDELGIKQIKSPAKVKIERPGPINKPSDLAPYIEHTILKPEATRDQIVKLCKEAKEFGFKGVCVNPIYIEEAKKQLKGTDLIVNTVIGFPLGAGISRVKAEEVREAVKAGANELDMVIQVGLLKGKEYKLVYEDIKAVVEAAGPIPVKVILETCLLDESEKIAGCILAMRAGASFVKTATGFSKGGATIEDIRLMRAVVGGSLGVKASGGIRDYQTAKAMVEAAANRIGCSASVEIVKG